MAEGKSWAAPPGTAGPRPFWTEFLRDLRDRGLSGVQSVINDAHSGLTNAVAAVLQGAGWQRCRVHFMRNVLAKVTKGHAEMVAATIRTIVAQPGQAEARAQVDLVAGMLTCQFPAVAQLLLDAKADLTAFADFPHSPTPKRMINGAPNRVDPAPTARSQVSSSPEYRATAIPAIKIPRGLRRLTIETADRFRACSPKYAPESKR